MIEAVFFARFHVDKGPIVLHQWPSGAAVPDPQCKHAPLFDFSLISEYIIPRQDSCQQSLAVCVNGYRILGHPICLVDDKKYLRNEYIFNFCIVVREAAEFSAYEKTAARVARVLADAEEQEDFLLDDETQCNSGKDADEDAPPHVCKMRILCESVVEDLNRYGECIIPLTDAHDLNLKLFPSVPPAPAVKPFHVPLALVDLDNVVNDLWDLTMQRVARHIDGVNHVARIAELAHADLIFVQQAVRQYLRFNLVVLLDMFQFNATYAPTPELANLLFDEAMQEECAQYAAVDDADVGKELVCHLYSSLSTGLTLKAWVLQHQSELERIDVRQFITAGLMKGIVYRIHRYAVKDTHAKNTGEQSAQDRQLDRFLDGTHCFDEICVALCVNPQDLTARLRSRKDVYIFER